MPKLAAYLPLCAIQGDSCHSISGPAGVASSVSSGSAVRSSLGSLYRSARSRSLVGVETHSAGLDQADARLPPAELRNSFRLGEPSASPMLLK
jgi:hypothetical protein